MIDFRDTGVWAIEPRFHDAYIKHGGKVAKISMEEATSKKALLLPYVAESARVVNASEKTMSGRVAVISLSGQMSRYGGYDSYGTEELASWLLEIETMPDIVGTVIEGETPGGTANGIEILGDVIKFAQKPIVGLVKGMVASGGMWVFSQCDEIMIESLVNSRMGSIGVMTMHVDESKEMEDSGRKFTIIRADGSEDKALFNSVEPLNAQVLAETKAYLNPIREQFIQKIKEGRPKVSEEVFSGKMYNGKDALRLGLADSVGYLGDAIKRVVELSK
jgi:protease-4